MRLTVKGQYALQAVLDIATNKNLPVRLSDIAKRQGLPYPFLEQIFRRLRKSSVVRSVRGPGGGYMLARQLHEISIKDILSGVGENVTFSRQLPMQNLFSSEARALNKYLHGLERLIYIQMADSSLQTLVKL